MRRKLFTLAAGVSAVLFVGVCGLWVVARFSQRQWASNSVMWLNETTLRRKETDAGWNERAMFLEYYVIHAESSSAPEMALIFRGWSIRRPRALPPATPEEFRLTWGRGYESLWAGPIEFRSRYRGIVLPFLHTMFWLAVLPTVWILVLLPPYLRQRKLLGTGTCPACGYDLRATPDRCPECGAVPAISSSSS